MPSRAAVGGMDRKAEEEPIVFSMGDDDNAARPHPPPHSSFMADAQQAE